MNKNSKKFLVIQTAFIGDAILATSILEKLNSYFPENQIDYLVRKGNDSLFKEHPFIKNLYIWDKNKGKYKQLFKILKSVRKEKYDYIINLQRFATTGIFTVFSKAKVKIGFKKNPFSFLFNYSFNHEINNGKHEVERNQLLIENFTDNVYSKPKLYPLQSDYEKVEEHKKNDFICISPASVWFTKQFPASKWLDFINNLDEKYNVFLLGGPDDKLLCDEIKNQSINKKVENLAGKLNLLQSAALMKDSKMNYTNDSAPLHLASAMNANVTSVFCSTIPDFGFGPLSDNSKIVQIKEKLECRPCGLHGKKECPLAHFNCAMKIDINDLKF
ncbi:MAG: glycosyltransferase family 9 protein [Bacteroidales bacterium]|nr:glycosyltransferase family 9 protein [Bacteroidales bacterium]MBN2755722.1 glycosyltransferase family 9 protein [Bacteroidales bacterium]